MPATQDPATACEVLIRGATVVDGTGAPAYRGDVAVSGGRVVALGDVGTMAAADEIAGAGKVLAPGFIDVHSHDDNALLVDPEMVAKTSQGVTTVVTGNCGASLAPLVASEPPPPPLNLLGDAGSFRFATFAQYMAALD